MQRGHDRAGQGSRHTPELQPFTASAFFGQGHSIGADGRATIGEVTWAERAPGNEGWRFAIAYSVVCAGLIASHFLQKAGLTDPVIEDKHAAALEKTISKASDASNSGKDFSFGSDEVPPEVKDMSTGHAISA